jgi:hypothetical protein
MSVADISIPRRWQSLSSRLDFSDGRRHTAPWSQRALRPAPRMRRLPWPESLASSLSAGRVGAPGGPGPGWARADVVSWDRSFWRDNGRSQHRWVLWGISGWPPSYSGRASRPKVARDGRLVGGHEPGVADVGDCADADDAQLDSGFEPRSATRSTASLAGSSATAQHELSVLLWDRPAVGCGWRYIGLAGCGCALAPARSLIGCRAISEEEEGP